jgi:hemerythrin superfamily protein
MSTTTRPEENLIAAVQADHEQIKAMFGEVSSAPTSEAKREAFERLVRKLAVHETAEQEVVHPLTRRAGDGDPIVEQRLEEEVEGTKKLAALEEMGVEADDFDSRFRRLEQEVLAHAEREEQQEHPRIAQVVEPERLGSLGRVFRAAERTAPTRPHPKAPTSATGNMVVSPVLALIDKTRDAIRDAMKDDRT